MLLSFARAGLTTDRLDAGVDFRTVRMN